MAQMIGHMQTRMKGTSVSFMVLVLKVLSCLIISLAFTLVSDQLIGFGQFSFVFMLLTLMAVMLRAIKPLGLGGVLILDLFCILIGYLLRMYILIAPGK